MTKTEINVVIAKACGWTKTDATRGYTLSQFPEYLPDYCSDLNAMCAAWKEKFGYFSEEWLSAHLQLQKIVAEDEGEEDTQDPYIQAATANATAYQRAKAFCKNLNLWTQTKKMNQAQQKTLKRIKEAERELKETRALLAQVAQVPREREPRNNFPSL